MSLLTLINGPNLNLLGRREPEIYGHATLSEIEAELRTLAEVGGHTLDCFQSNAESALIDRIHACMDDGTALIVLNPSALGHTSIALRDAILATRIPMIQLHLSEPTARENFRHHSFLSDIALGTISGFGKTSYTLALVAAMDYLDHEAEES